MPHFQRLLIGPHRCDTRLVATVAALLGMAATSTAVAQPLPSSRAAMCVSASSAPLSDQRDTSDITGVVVRFTANATGRPSDGYLSKALSVLTAERLQALVEAPVRSRFDVTAQRNKVNAASAIAEGRLLGLRWVVTGRAERRGDSVTVTWSALDSFTGKVAGTGVSKARFVELDALSQSMAGIIARTVGATNITSRLPSTSPAPTRAVRSVQAFELYLEGLYPFDSFDPAAQREAVAALQRAVAIEPTLQPAWTALAETLTRLVEWGEGSSATGRRERSTRALAAANRALALAPRDVHTLVLLAHVHLLRDEPVAATQVVEAVRRLSPAHDDLMWLDMELALVRGNESDIKQVMLDKSQQQERSPRALYYRADWARRSGAVVDACQLLNRLIVLEPAWAPAYVHRALVRTQLGDRRGGWEDAEMATRLGQPVWGNAVSALIDYSVSDSLRTRTRQRRLSVIDSNSVLPAFDVLLRSAVWRATGQVDRAVRVLSVAPCDDPARRRFRSDPLLLGIPIPSACRTSGNLALSPAGM